MAPGACLLLPRVNFIARHLAPLHRAFLHRSSLGSSSTLTPSLFRGLQAAVAAVSSGGRRRSFTHEAMGLTEVLPGRTRIGWIGTGVMGQAMCGHILEAGFSLTVFNRTPSKAEALCQKGAVLVNSPNAVAHQSDIVFTIVGYPSDVREVILGEKGVVQGLQPGGIVSSLTLTGEGLGYGISGALILIQRLWICQQVTLLWLEKFMLWLRKVDAPVSGGDKGAKAGTLAIMAGGGEDTVKGLLPLFKCMGTPTYMGPAGSGQSCKLANQITIASTMVGLVEGMLYAHKAGLDVTTYLQAIGGGAAGSKSLELYATRIQKRDFAPGFYVHHFVKDLGIALHECQQMGISLPGLALAQQLYVSLKGYGEGNLGTQALILTLERLNNLTLPTRNTD